MLARSAKGRAVAETGGDSPPFSLSEGFFRGGGSTFAEAKDRSATSGLRAASHPEMVRPPVADPLFDVVLAGDLLVHHDAGQVHDLGVAGESQSDDLAHTELANPAPKILRQEPLQAMSLLQANHAVLRPQREDSQVPGEQ